MTDPWYRTHFDELYLRLYSHRTSEEAERQVASILERTAPRAGGRILDLACGAGRHTEAFRKRGAKVVGLDLSRQLLRAAQASTPAPLVRGDMRVLPFADASFALVASLFTSFGYFDDDEQHVAVLAEIRRVLETDGRLLLDLPNRQGLLQNLVPETTEHLAGATVVSKRNYEPLTKRVEKTMTITDPSGSEETRRESVRVYDLLELQDLGRRAGLSIAEVYGGFDFAAFHPDESPRALVVLEKRPTVFGTPRPPESVRTDATDESRALEAVASGKRIIITGQQPGLFGGPLYTFAKIATTIALRDSFRAAGAAAEAVFWCASEDHDFDEANRLYLLDEKAATVRLGHVALEGRGRSLDRLVFDEKSILEVDAHFERSGVRRPEDRPEVGESMALWTKRIVRRNAHETGLLIVEPERLMPAAAPEIRAWLAAGTNFAAALAERLRGLAMHGRETHLSPPGESDTGFFLNDDQGRRKLERTAEGYRTKFEAMSEVEFAERLDREPNVLSTSVYTRPLVQQFLFDAAIQVVGPSEAAYLRELTPLYDLAGVRAPIFWHRLSVALVTPRDRERLAQLGWPRERLLEPPGSWPDVVPRIPPGADARAWKKSHAAATAARKLLSEAHAPRGKPQERIFTLASFYDFDTVAIVRAMIEAARRYPPKRVLIDVSETRS